MAESEQKNNVLVVDDEDSIRLVLSGILDEEGFVATPAASGEEALDLFKQDPFELVIADIVMPGISGIELLKEIKKIRPETEVIIITSHASLETAINAVTAGAFDYLIKPFEDLSFISSIAKHAFEKIRLVEQNSNLLKELKETNVELEKSNAELADAVETLKELANRDGLTGLFNHRFFKEAMKAEISRARRYEREFSLIFIDIDNFKVFNDNNGHPAGDQVLKNMTELISGFLRNSDVFSRYGGEEFTVILPETSKKNAETAANSIREIVEGHSFPGEEKQPKGRLTISLGLSTYPEDGEAADDLVTAADEALYKSKEGGRNKLYVAGRD
jgi:diguanylate cyclase (GGDEF)-like protein